jgi:hypothetical protein
MKKSFFIPLLIFAMINALSVFSCSLEKKENPPMMLIMDTLQNEVPQLIYLWTEGNVPAITQYTENGQKGMFQLSLSIQKTIPGILILLVFDLIWYTFPQDMVWK